MFYSHIMNIFKNFDERLQFETLCQGFHILSSNKFEYYLIKNNANNLTAIRAINLLTIFPTKIADVLRQIN